MFFKRESGNGLSLYFLGFRFNLSRNGKQNCCPCDPYRPIQFRSFQMLANDIRRNASKIPADVDLIVGIPRSGMIPAYILGLFLNKKVCTLSEFLNNIPILNGERKILNSQSNKILFVDDSIYSGTSLRTVKTKVHDFKKSTNIDFHELYLAIYATTKSKNLVDCFFEIVDQPRLFQWNYLNHSIASKCCFDLDGVLCQDPTNEQNDDGEKYRQFIRNAAPLFVPTYTIHAIVTSRLEKYRRDTEMWLKEHNVKYNKLIMLNLKTAEERRKSNCHASFKAKIYKEDIDAICFIESNPQQAREIAKLSGKQVICVQTDEFFPGNNN